MVPWRLSLEAEPARDDVMEIYNAIVAYNNDQIGDHWRGRLTIFARAEQQLLGGIYGFTDRSWLRIEVLVVKEAWRRQGLGGQLLTAAEDEARKRDCHNVWLDTFSFQALPFYQQRGYDVFGALESYPGEHVRYFLRKAL